MKGPTTQTGLPITACPMCDWPTSLEGRVVKFIPQPVLVLVPVPVPVLALALALVLHPWRL